MILPLVCRLFLGHVLFVLCLSDAISVDSITSQDVEAALERAQEKVKVEEKLQKELISKGNFINPSVISAEARHQLRGGNLGQRTNNNAQSILEAATRDLVSRFGLKDNNIGKLSKIPLDGELGRQVSQNCTDTRTTNCNATSKYRTIDGSCNNLQRPNEGRTFTCLVRLIPSDYEDGVSAPRTQNNRLPNPRVASIAVHRATKYEEINEPYLTAWHMSFGQFCDHDMEFTTQPTTVNNAPINCCTNNTQIHEACLPIPLNNDPDFSSNCMNFVRDISCSHCQLGGHREQMNSLSGFIDCSQIYGTTAEQAALLRTTNGDGKLLSRIISGVGERPPATNNTQTDQCSRPGFPCFLTGDFRSNQNILLSAHHIIFLIFHNQLVDRLRILNPRWDGEKLYQEARRIVCACFQHIVINEYLPLVIGADMMNSYALGNYNTQYNSNINPSIVNAFAAAGFRFGHSTVPDCFWTLTETNQRGQIELKNSFFNPTPMYQPGLLENIVRGSVRQPQQFFDNTVVRGVTQFLYQRLNTTAGLDLASINIQRGRDHGLPGYTAYVKKLLNIDINSCGDLKNCGLVSNECADRLCNLYSSVHDIDLWTGLLFERYYGKSLVGPTTANLIAYQFYQLTYGDRYFYTHQGQAGSFTQAQKSVIYNIWFARIICDCLKLPEIGQAVFEHQSPIISCSDSNLPQLDLRPWKE